MTVRVWVTGEDGASPSFCVSEGSEKSGQLGKAECPRGAGSGHGGTRPG